MPPFFQGGGGDHQPVSRDVRLQILHFFRVDGDDDDGRLVSSDDDSKRKTMCDPSVCDPQQQRGTTPTIASFRQNLQQNRQWGTSLHLGSRPNRSALLPPCFLLGKPTDIDLLAQHLEALAKRIGVQPVVPRGPVGQSIFVCDGDLLARRRAAAGLGIGLEPAGPTRRQSRRGGMHATRCLPPGGRGNSSISNLVDVGSAE